MRLSFIEGLCLVAIGATMVELHDSHRLARTGIPPETALATAAKPAAAASQGLSMESSKLISDAVYR